MDWQFRVAHYGLFLSFGFVFSFRSMVFDGLINFADVLMLIAIVVLQTRRFPLVMVQDTVNFAGSFFFKRN